MKRLLGNLALMLLFAVIGVLLAWRG